MIAVRLRTGQPDGRYAGDANDNNNLLHQIFVSFSKNANASIFHSMLRYVMAAAATVNAICDCNRNGISEHMATVPR